MSQPTTNPRTLLILFLVIGAALLRLAPHPPNFTPLLAAAVFAGRMLERRTSAAALILFLMLAIDIPVIWEALSADFAGLWRQISLVNFVLYGTVAGLTLAARCTKRFCGFYAVPASALSASAVFFLTTNFASWLAFYDLSWSGLAACYMNAIPYFQNTCLSALCYSGILFGILAGYDRLRQPITEKARRRVFAD